MIETGINWNSGQSSPSEKEDSKLQRQREVGIWIRVSTEDQARGESPEHHEKRAGSYAESRDWNVREVYHLEAVSGKAVSGHPEAKRMLKDIQSGHISALIFSKLARLARNTRELLDFADLFREANADLVSLQESIDTSTPAGRLFYTMIAAMAQWEREEIADRVKASIKVRAQLGKSLGGPAPFGYQWKANKLVVDPNEAPIRKRLHELFAEHKRLKTVARLLNEAGYRTRNRAKFSDATLTRLLQDTSAKGLYRANHTYRDREGKLKFKPESEWILTPVEAIVSEELWDQCNQILEERRNGRPAPGPKPVHLFAGLLWCGCGQKMYVFSKSPKYICRKCKAKIPLDDLEAIFREQLQGFFVSEEQVKKHLEAANEHLQEKSEALEAHKRQLEKVQAEMNRVYMLYQEEQITTEGFGRLYKPLEAQEKSLQDEEALLEGELDALRVNQISASEVVSEAQTLHAMWPKLDIPEKRQIIESITDRIVLNNDAVEITLSHLPSSVESTKRQRHLWDSWRRPA